MIPIDCKIATFYDSVIKISFESMYHAFQSNAVDRSKVIEELQKAYVYDATSNQELTHSGVYNGQSSYGEWMTTLLKKVVRYSVNPFTATNAIWHDD